MEVLRIEQVRKSFGELEVLKGISVTQNSGEVLSVIGPSGSGKSTLLRCITNLERIDSGLIQIAGRTLAEGNPATYAPAATLQEIRLSIGLVFQNFNLFPHFSVLRNITEAQVHVLKRSKEEARERSYALLKKMGLEEKAKSYPCQLSGGQQQRVSIARSLALSPALLCFDEPTSALDPELTGDILSVIKELAQEHMTMLVVTHEMSFARDISDRVIFMDEGKVIEQGTPEELFSATREQRTRQFLQRFNA